MPQPSTVPILHGAVRLMHTLVASPGRRSIQQLAAAADLPTTSCFRILNTLEQERWITRPGGGREGYRLSTGLLPLLASLQDFQRLFERARPGLQRLADATGMGVKLSIREGLEAVTVQRAEPRDAVAVTNPIGSRFGVVLGSTGAALLAGADEADLARVIDDSPAAAWANQRPEDLRSRIRCCVDDGHCFDRGSYHPQLGGLSAAIGGRAVSLAVTVTGMLSDLDRLDTAAALAVIDDLRRDLTEAAASPLKARGARS